jgi:hypothetical protein
VTPGHHLQREHTLTNIRGDWRGYVGIASLIGGATIAACSSSTAPGPSSASLARLFDSAYVADSTVEGPAQLRPIVENYLALMADEGVTPVTVLVKTDGGTLAMHMMGAVSYDTTATGLVADSVALEIGWSSDYSKYLVVLTDAVTPNGPRASRVPVIPGPVRALALQGARRRIHTETAIASLTPIVFIADGSAATLADSVAGDVAWSGAGRCLWQHIPISTFNADSASACSRVIVSLDFAFHFPPEPGIDTALTHMSITPSGISGARLVGFNGF